MSNLPSLVTELRTALELKQFDSVNGLLSRAKRSLLLENALIPTSSTPPQLIPLAREVLECGALASIRQTDAPTFTRYYQQLQPFYDLERHASTGESVGNVSFSGSQRSKITGLYLLLLLSMGDSTSFHSVLEGLVEEASLNGKSVEDDPCIKYPVELERNLMEGSYDKVWRETKSERVPSEDFGLFSNVSCLPVLVIVWIEGMICTNCWGFFFFFIGPRWHHSQRNCGLLRESVPVSAHLQRQKPAFPRVRRRRYRVRSAAWLDPARWPDTLPCGAAASCSV